MNKVLIPQELKSLIMSGHKHVFHKGQSVNVHDPHFGIAVVESGYIKRYSITGDGNHSIQYIIGPDHVFPFTPVYRTLVGFELYEGEEVYYYSAMSDTIVRSISIDTLKDYADQNPQIYQDLFHVVGNRLTTYISSIDNQSVGNVQQRLAHQLMIEAYHFGVDTPDGIKIQVPLSNTDLAAILHVSRETTSRAFSRLQKKGIVAGGKNITILDYQKLHKEVY